MLIFTRISCFIVIILLATVSFSTAGENRISVSFIAVSSPSEQFWGNIIAMAQAAADDLDIDLEVLYADRNHIRAVELARTVCSRKEKPDFLIVVGEKTIGSQSLVLAEEAGIDTILFGTLTGDEQDKIGLPRQKLHHWVGQRKINDYAMGRDTARAIIRQAIAAGLAGKDNSLNVLGLAGVSATSFSDERVRGLKDAVAEDKRVHLLQVVPTDWTREEGYRKALGLLQRYQLFSKKKVGVIWAANSQISLGGIQAAKELGMVSGRDFFTSGIDWEAEAFNSIEKGEMLTVSGGHFAEVAWILVMIHDYVHGFDIAAEQILSASFQLDRETLPDYLRVFGSGDWQQIDFTRFSLHLNPELKKHTFSFASIMEQFSTGQGEKRAQAVEQQ